MEYFIFAVFFVVLHVISYTFAGATALKFSADLYRGSERLYDFHRDMNDEEESRHVKIYFLPAQIVRGALLAVVLFPVLALLSELTFVLLFAFIFGLLFIFTDLACVNPFPHNIEGLVYMRERYIRRDKLVKLYYETTVYSLLMALGVSWVILYSGWV